MPAKIPAAKRHYRILVVDDQPELLNYMIAALTEEGCSVDVAQSGQEALRRVKQGPVPDLVLLDMMMPSWDGLETLQRIQSARPCLATVILSSLVDTRKAVQATRMGALDYMTKPVDLDALQQLLRHLGQPDEAAKPENSLAGEAEAEEMDSQHPPREVWVEGGNQECIIVSEPMRMVRSLVMRFAPLDVPVLLLGESGTGKEVIANLVHEKSARARGLFMKVNCAALPQELLESELFGYEKGAFTGANSTKPGKFQACSGGTLLLDEIGEIPPALQAKLLHILQDGTYSPLGSNKTLRADVRILSATNVEVQQAIACGRFRADLYYRLSTFTIHIPPLRERHGVIPVLLKHFMARFAQQYEVAEKPITPAIVNACEQYPWPGNVRELENFVKRYLILGEEQRCIAELQTPLTLGGNGHGNLLKAAPLPVPIQLEPQHSFKETRDLKALTREVSGKAEAETIAAVLQQTGGVRKEAARLLNISTKALLYKMRRYGLDH